jgi:hypothetical protein
MPNRIPGTKATRSYRVPVCSQCGSNEHVQKNEAGEWFCVACADEWLVEYVDAKAGDISKGGVKLPHGVRDERKATPSFRDLMPNRRVRRRMQHR